MPYSRSETQNPVCGQQTGFYFYSLSFCQFAGFRVIRQCEQTAFFSKIFCLSVNSPARQRALLVTP
ncbi:hypothetical protein BU54_34795 [Escherichia coli O45:H2 str. 2010C-4211]|nr:hypothetical protein BU54_34795 [Escherichia coli O45:H2 str. 2010C-4211]